MTARKDAALQKKLQEWKESLGREELEEIIRQTKALEEYQEEPNSKEALARIPLLKRGDINGLPNCGLCSISGRYRQNCSRISAY